MYVGRSLVLNTFELPFAAKSGGRWNCWVVGLLGVSTWKGNVLVVENLSRESIILVVPILAVVRGQYFYKFDAVCKFLDRVFIAGANDQPIESEEHVQHASTGEAYESCTRLVHGFCRDLKGTARGCLNSNVQPLLGNKGTSESVNLHFSHEPESSRELVRA